MPRKPVNTPGFIYEIVLANASLAYALIVNTVESVFFDINPKVRPLVDDILNSPVLFRTMVMHSALRKWKHIASVKVPEQFASPGRYYREDAAHKGRFAIVEIYSPHFNGIPATREECVGLECDAVWSQNHIEDRLLDEFNGKTSRWGGPLK